jgi:hypothetical protein
VKKIALLLPLLALAACGQEPAPAPEPTATAAAAPVSTLPPPDKEHFADAFAVCQGAKPVNEVSCKRAGLGSEDVICDYSLGDDEFMRNKATLNPNAGKDGWVLADATNVCTGVGATAAEPAEPTETAASEAQ